MTDEEIFGKAFRLLGSDIPGEREAAVHQLYKLLYKSGRSFADLHEILANSVPQSLLADAEQRLAELSAEHAALVRRHAALHAVLWLQPKWRYLAAAAVLLVAAGVGYHYWPDGSAEERNAVDTALHGIVEKSNWGEGYTTPVVRMAAGKPYWTLLYGETDSDMHTDADGRPVPLQCLRLFAAPAVAESGVYVKPEPFNFVGWLKWPERAALCRRAQSKEASR